jgi:tetratricopeptide (TPR) repeat protein
MTEDLFQAGVAHHRAGRLAEAERAYRQVLAAAPRHADALNLLGVVAAQCGRHAAAVELIRRAIELDDRIAAYHVNLGSAERGRGGLDAAEASYRRALALAPDDPDANSNLGVVLQDRGRYDEAAASFERCLAVRPDHVEALINLALARRNQGRLAEAVALCERALALRPDSVEALNNLGLALDNGGQIQAALSRFRQALALRPGDAQLANNLGLSLYHAGEAEAALQHFDHALAFNHDQADAQLSQAMVRLSTGALRDGWRQYEWRWRSRQLNSAARAPGVPLWDGSDGHGRRMLVWAEQGFGDSLQFCRYVPLLAQRGWQVALEVPAPLIRLFRRLDGASAVGPEQAGPAAAAGGPIDCHCPMMSLPRLFDTMLETIPADIPYLTADPADILRWRTRLAAAGLPPGRLAVGLVWAGNPRGQSPLLALTDARRSVALDRLGPLFAVPGTAFVSLQKDRRPGERPEAYGMIDLMDETADFADTAAIMVALDLIIAVDTAPLHLAAALGRPVWLLNRFDTCWRWLRNRDDSPWYPTLRQFRQPSFGDWAAVIDAVAAALRQAAERRGSAA